MEARRRIRTFAPWVAWYAVTFHAIAGITILVSPEAGLSTGPDGVVRFFGSHEVSGVVMIGASVLGALVVIGRLRNVLGLLPQQFLLLLSAFNALSSVLIGEYADGVQRPFQFILTDQLPVILMACFHGSMLIELHARHESETAASPFV